MISKLIVLFLLIIRINGIKGYSSTTQTSTSQSSSHSSNSHDDNTTMNYNQNTKNDDNIGHESVRNIDFISNLKFKFNQSENTISISFRAYKQPFRLDLYQNVDFLINGAIIEVQGEGGHTWTTPLTTNNVYKGHLKDSLGSIIPDSFARIVVHSHDLESVHFDGIMYTPSHGMMHIKHQDHYSKSKRSHDASLPVINKRDLAQSTNMILIRDLNPKDMICANSQMDLTSSAFSPKNTSVNCVLSPKNLVKRSSGSTVSSCGTITNIDEAPISKLAVPGLIKAALNPSSCPLPNTRMLAMGVAADCSYVVEKGGVSEALTAILSIWNSASQIYESTFNVRLGVVKIRIQQTCTPLDSSIPWNTDCSQASYTIADRLSDFSQWRGTQSNDGMGLWHLMTKCSTQPSVGIAWVSQLCQSGASSQNGQTVSGTGVSSVVPVEWKVVAHEIGHGFGAQHDCSSSGCNGQCRPCAPNCDCQSQYLMNPLDNAISNDFSPASIADICNGIATMGSCLQNPSEFSLVSAGVCGNGIKEGNEQCDCGPSNGTTCLTDPCCDGSTCKLKPNQQCDPLNDACCSSTCSILPSSTICHRGDGICDNTVTCPGTNATCPFNTFVADGTACTRADGLKATCSSGVCTSRDLQCSGNSSTVTTVKACPAFGNDCTLNCQDKYGNCFQLTGYFLDGTTCGGTGKCRAGVCIGSTLWSQANLWIQTYPQYAYPIIAALGLLLLSILYAICRRCCFAPQPKRKKRTNRISKPPSFDPYSERGMALSNQTLAMNPVVVPLMFQPSPHLNQRMQEQAVGYPRASNRDSSFELVSFPAPEPQRGSVRRSYRESRPPVPPKDDAFSMDPWASEEYWKNGRGSMERSDPKRGSGTK